MTRHENQRFWSRDGERRRLDITPSEQVTATFYPATAGDRADISLILAHGAGANQTSGFMVRFAGALAARGIDTVTFNFVYSEEGRRLPDRNDKLETCYRKVIEAFRGGIFVKDPRKLAIGGKSMGGRIASQVAAANGDGIAGLVFLGYLLKGIQDVFPTQKPINRTFINTWEDQ